MMHFILLENSEIEENGVSPLNETETESNEIADSTSEFFKYTSFNLLWKSTYLNKLTWKKC